MSELELLPCPFCGGEGAFGSTNDGGRFIDCKGCQCSTKLIYPNKADPVPFLVDAWNDRPTTPPATVPREGYAAWLVENGKKQGDGLAYLRMGYAGMFAWTEDPHAALHFCRRSDAEAVSAECEDARRIVEHWFATKL